jgi:hypothetical protein
MSRLLARSLLPRVAVGELGGREGAELGQGEEGGREHPDFQPA